jgi:hypothetical protein
MDTRDDLLMLATDVHDRASDLYALLAGGASLPAPTRGKVVKALARCMVELEQAEADLADVDALEV